MFNCASEIRAPPINPCRPFSTGELKVRRNSEKLRKKKKFTEWDVVTMADREKSGGDSSSSSEDEDPKWKAAINSIVTTTAYAASASKLAATAQQHEDGDFRVKPKKLTHAQIKVSHCRIILLK